MKRLEIYLYVLILITGLLSCSDSESKLKPLPGQTAVIINLNLPPENPTAYDNSILNKIRSFFVKEAMAQTAPATFSNISVTVTGPDITLIQQNFLPTGTITLSVPAGDVRRFDVTATVAPGDPSAALSFSGTTTSNLPEGQTVSLPVLMLLNETKIVIPDSANCGGCGSSRRIIMIENLSTAAATWTPKTTFPGFAGTLFPMDISFDSRGRIYIANSTPGVIRIDDINGTNLIQGSATVYGTGTAINNVVTIAVDRINNLLYFATTSALYKSPLNGSSPATQLNLGTLIPGGNFIRGIDVDSAGMLYVVHATSSAGNNSLFKYDPNTQLQVGTGQYNFAVSNANPCDVLVRLPYIYIANFSGAAGAQILQLTFSGSIFSLVAGNGTKTASFPDTATGRFYGASRFLAIRNDVLIVADSDQSQNGAKLVSFSDMLFSNWTTYGNYVSGNPSAAGEFKLYSTC